MSEVKWIKLDNDIFNNRKIKQIEKMPDGDSIIVIWLKLLTLAGHVNDGGFIYITKDIPYTDQLLANEFDRPLATIQMALEVFRNFGMVDLHSNILHVSNWEEYQNIEGMEKIREQNRLRKQNQRVRQKQARLESHVTSRDSHATDIDIEKDIEKEIEKEDILSDKLDSAVKEIIFYLNEKTGKAFKATTKTTKEVISARVRDGFKIDDFKRVIDIKVAQWGKDPKMQEYLRPQTLFGTKMESYLQSQTKQETQIKTTVTDEEWEKYCKEHGWND